MLRIKEISQEIKGKLLDFLYKDGLFNVFMIHFIENQPENLGELYINEEKGEIKEVLHIKYDGNSYFTNFYYTSKKGLMTIADQIKVLDRKGVLLAGKLDDVAKLIKLLGNEQQVTPNIYYKLNMDSYIGQDLSLPNYFRKAADNEKDISKIKDFLIGFFEATTQEEIDTVANIKKIREDLKVGVYFIKDKNKIMGMARFSSYTKYYKDITTVYIDPKYRRCGFGKELMLCMIKTSILEGKVPVTQTSIINEAARATYESLGFIRQDDYAFEFIS